MVPTGPCRMSSRLIHAARSQRSPSTLWSHFEYVDQIWSRPLAHQRFLASEPRSSAERESASSTNATGQKPSDRAGGSDAQADSGTGAERDADDSSGVKSARNAAAGAQQRIQEVASSTFRFTKAVVEEMSKSSPFARAAGQRADAAGADARVDATAEHGRDGSSSSSSSGGAADEAAQRGEGASAFAGGVYERVRSTFAGVGERLRSSDGNRGATPGARAGEDAPLSFVQQLRRQVADAVLPDVQLKSVMKRPSDVEAVEIQVGEGPADLVLQERRDSWLDKMRLRLGDTALMRRIESLRTSETASKIAEGYESIKERFEHSDSDVVNRVRDMRESMMSENEQAIAYRETRMRNPNFDMPTFLRAIKTDVPIVIKAYLEGNEATLKEYCSDTIVERLMGIYKVTQAQGHVADPTILEFSDVDMVDIKLLDDDPVIILHFSCQQINCIRDQYGNVIEGSPDEVNRVYYYWAVQQDGHGMVTKDGEYIPPRWKLIEMLMRGMHQLL